MRAARDHDLSDALRAQVLGGDRADLAGADDEHAAPVQTAEYLARQRHGGEADRDGAFPERGLRADPLADAERPAESVAQHRPGASFGGGRLIGVLHLPENLRLANDERVEAGGDAKQVRESGA